MHLRHCWHVGRSAGLLLLACEHNRRLLVTTCTTAARRGPRFSSIVREWQLSSDTVSRHRVLVSTVLFVAREGPRYIGLQVQATTL